MARGDEELMKAYQRGDAQAFQALVARWERPLWNFVRRFAQSQSATEDVVQEVFLRVVRGKNDWRGDSKVSTWLYTIARNLCTDEARKATHRVGRSLDEPVAGRADEGSGPVLLDRIAGSEPAADATLDDRQIARCVEEALITLPPEQREVFLMREMMDMSFADIAAAVGASEPTVKSRMRYALGRLRDALAPLRDGGDASLMTTEGGSRA